MCVSASIKSKLKQLNSSDILNGDENQSILSSHMLVFSLKDVNIVVLDNLVVFQCHHWQNRAMASTSKLF